MGNWLDKTGLAKVRNLLTTKFATKIDKHPYNVPSGKFLQTDANGDAVWGDAPSQQAITDATATWLDTNYPSRTEAVIDKTLTTENAAAEAKATGDLILITRNQPTVINNPTNKLWIEPDNVLEYTLAEQDDLDALKKKVLLEAEYIPDTEQSYAYDASGKISTIVHTQNEAAIRTDAFTFNDGEIVEVRTLGSGESLTIIINLTTLATTAVYADAE